jgi:recombination protein RecA
LGEHDDPSKITDWIPTGSDLLDLAISNRPNAGLPVGRIIELSGLEGTGKSLIAAQVIAETQKRGGVGFYFDTENAASKEFWEALGLDTSSKALRVFAMEKIEDIFNTIEAVIASARKHDSKMLITIVVDSVAGATTSAEQEADHGKDGWNTSKAIIISKALRKITTMIGEQRILLIFTNQLRENLAAAAAGGRGEKYITPGGKALPFHASVRILLKKKGKIKSKDGTIIGTRCIAEIVKNRMGPPSRKVEFNLFFDSGIANAASWIDFMKEHGIITGDTRKYRFKKADGEVEEFAANDFLKLFTEKPEIKAEMYAKIQDIIVMKYKNPNSLLIESEDISIDSGEDDDGKPKEEDEDVVDEG